MLMNKSVILAVEDDKVAQVQLASLLGEKYILVQSYSITEAREHLTAGNVDLILLDIILPDGSGLELCREIKYNAQLQHIPIIVVTSLNNDKDVEEGLSSGAIDYLRKPYSGVELSARINSALRIKSYIDELQKANSEKEVLIDKLKQTLQEIKELSGLLPICSSCKKIRDDSGYWSQVEDYLTHHSGARFTHSLCPECISSLYPQLSDSILNDGKKDKND